MQACRGCTRPSLPPRRGPSRAPSLAPPATLLLQAERPSRASEQWAARPEDMTTLAERHERAYTAELADWRARPLNGDRCAPRGHDGALRSRRAHRHEGPRRHSARIARLPRPRCTDERADGHGLRCCADLAKQTRGRGRRELKGAVPGADERTAATERERRRGLEVRRARSPLQAVSISRSRSQAGATSITRQPA